MEEAVATTDANPSLRAAPPKLLKTYSRGICLDLMSSDGWGLTPRGAHTWGYPRYPWGTPGVGPVTTDELGAINAQSSYGS